MDSLERDDFVFSVSLGIYGGVRSWNGNCYGNLIDLMEAMLWVIYT